MRDLDARVGKAGKCAGLFCINGPYVIYTRAVISTDVESAFDKCRGSPTARYCGFTCAPHMKRVPDIGGTIGQYPNYRIDHFRR
jgi:hypothetical protein